MCEHGLLEGGCDMKYSGGTCEHGVLGGVSTEYKGGMGEHGWVSTEYLEGEHGVLGREV